MLFDLIDIMIAEDLGIDVNTYIRKIESLSGYKQEVIITRGVIGDDIPQLKRTFNLIP